MEHVATAAERDREAVLLLGEGLAWYSIDGSFNELRQIAHVSAQMSQLHMQTAFHFLISKRTPSPLAAGAAAALLAGASTAIASVFSSAGPAERPSPAGCSAIFAIYVVSQAKGGLTRPVGGERKRSSVCESPCEQRPAVLVLRRAPG
eukprot:CAMPEP_0182531232 /NCGR_PEP_ID=MMETSP1323-20130603/8334_1 /TAXON_ID=236787 /ORGANISM="Florenciella parvula, Strain RCC1693" /LENGTH=147 /DNA_ID=CAMNT_0024740751 /DNA_START=497 /DNA_END=938 /DNA_ORIENTATION=+